MKRKTGKRPPRPFWSQVHFGTEIKSPHVSTPCWEWMGGLDKHGYGQRRHEGRTQRAHRVAWELENGQTLPGVSVLHACDNRKCVRHLFAGTKKDNALDMVRKGRCYQSNKTHCPRGHEYAVTARLYNGRRNCRACETDRSLRRQSRGLNGT